MAFTRSCGDFERHFGKLAWANSNFNICRKGLGADSPPFSRHHRGMTPTDDDIAACLMAMARARGAEKSLCPSEVARCLSSDWRPLMPRVRAVAATLPLLATQKGRPVDPHTAPGPIRLRLGPDA